MAGLYTWLGQKETLRDSRATKLVTIKDRDEIAANISHEIRTPLTGVLGVMHLLRRTNLDRNQRRYVDTASNSAKMLLAIVNDVVASVRMDSGWYPVESESLELAEAIEDVTSILAPEAINKGVELVCDLDPNVPQRVQGDALCLRQVLNNLLLNAIKYTDKGMIAVYSCYSGNKVEIGVRDTGPGLSWKRQKLLLLPFSRMDEQYRQKSGAAGLGIKVSRRLLEAMGSGLRLESKKGHGSRFFFELAIDVDHPQAEVWKPPQAMRDLSVTILSPLELQRRSIMKMLAHWRIGNIREFDYDVESDGEISGLEPCDLLIIDQTETEQAVNRLIDRMRHQNEWRETRFVHLVPQNRLGNGGSADTRLHKPLSHSRLYSMMLDIVYKQAFSYEFESEAIDGKAPIPDGVLSGQRLLLVEDNDINKMIVLEMLEPTAAEIDVATNGADAVNQVQQLHYDLILMDIGIPLLDGYEATRQIRSLGGYFASLPIIAMTAHALEGDQIKSLDAGMDYHFSKPFDPEDLIALIVRFIDERSGAAQTG